MKETAPSRRGYSPNLNSFMEMLIDGGPSHEELKLMGVLTIMDETLANLAQDYNSEYRLTALQTYKEIEDYIFQCEDQEH